MPLMTEKRHKLFAVSSIKEGGGGGFTAIVAAKNEETGEPLMSSVILGNPCDMCAASDTPHHCTHNSTATADWKDPKKVERIAMVYSATGHTSAMLAEMYNMVGGATGAAFAPELYKDLFTTPAIVTQDQVEVVYIGVDPATRGTCDFAITAIGWSPGRYKYQVCIFLRANWGKEEKWFVG